MKRGDSAGSMTTIGCLYLGRGHRGSEASSAVGVGGHRRGRSGIDRVDSNCPWLILGNGKHLAARLEAA